MEKYDGSIARINTSPGQAVDFAGDIYMRQRIFDGVQNQPGYRTARNLAEELSGPMSNWGTLQAQYVDRPNISDAGRAQLMRQLAPVSDNDTIRKIMGGIRDEQLKSHGGELHNLYRGTLVLDYLKATSQLRLMGPMGALQLHQRAHSRDEYPVWHGHLNQVIGEITSVVHQELPVPQKFQVANQLGGLLLQGWTGVGNNYQP